MQAIIFANGELTEQTTAATLAAGGDLLLAADGGARHCQQLGITPDKIIGDLDSLTAEERHRWEAAGVEIIIHPPNKDETDLELALLHALELGCTQALVLGALGKRWDQTLANLLLPGYAKLAGLAISFWDAGTWFYLIADHHTIQAAKGTTISLLPLGGNVHGVTTAGLAYPLNNETLYRGATRGVSNEMLNEQASITLTAGLLLCIVQPSESTTI